MTQFDNIMNVNLSTQLSSETWNAVQMINFKLD